MKSGIRRTGVSKAGKSKTVLNADVVILGFTGSIGSGATYVSEGIRDVLGKNAHYYQLSNFLRHNQITGKKDRKTIDALQNCGNELRKNNGNSFLVESCLRQIIKDANLSPDSVVLIDSIRNTGEVRCLRVFPNFYLVSIHADEDRRKARLVGSSAKKAKFKTPEEFLRADARDQEEDIEWGQQVTKCNYLADIIVNNNEDYARNSQKGKEFIDDIHRRFIDPIMEVRNRNKIPDRPPSINETLMTMAYCMSKRSSCEKRKVGALIAHIADVEKLKDKVKRPEDHRHVQVISAGFNEVPLGTNPCRLGDYEMCYRDYVKRDMIKDFKHCPQCGESLKGNEECQSCHTKLTKFGLMASDGRLGKLLDMCRALHAEEIAILGLSGISKPKEGKLVLYTTTFPCNLCANKIVAAGIDVVCYAEPYSMKESREILEAAEVEVVKFEGIKSTAYFRLYS